MVDILYYGYCPGRNGIPGFVVKLLQTAKESRRASVDGSILEGKLGRRLPKEMLDTNVINRLNEVNVKVKMVMKDVRGGKPQDPIFACCAQI